MKSKKAKVYIDTVVELGSSEARIAYRASEIAEGEMIEKAIEAFKKSCYTINGYCNDEELCELGCEMGKKFTNLLNK